MLERHAETMNAMMKQQSTHQEQIEQLKLSLDKAQAEADLTRDKYEQGLKQTSWVVTKISELEGLVSRLRERDLTIRRELGMNVEGFGLRKPVESTSAQLQSGPSYFAMTPDIPAAHEGADEDHVDPW